ncbi:MAG: alpha-hydroxy acid oxidase [Piscinibacter sp.]|uniref:alpha-hydroxy acid oxidase n=1 Tax=Piscinibacter sp. TaxID=1903157 RepID=UPI002C296645|nr:alpha-hydroxy acid oxidase [Piscinibacter sp.]
MSDAGAPVSLADYEARARETLDANAWAYFAGGAADEITLAANRAAWAAHWLQPRVLRASAQGHTRVELLGRTLAHPILVAPMAFQRLAHESGELGVALAAAAQGAGMVLSAQASVPLEQVARLVRPEPARGPLWFQLYLQGERGFDLELVRRAEAAGYEALVLTVDAPVHGARDRERRAGFRLPPDVAAVNLAAAPTPARRGELCGGLLASAPSWDDVAWLRAQTTLPLVLKGVLHPEDAKLAHALGADALIVSNHGGRTLDTALPSAWALPRIADALAGVSGAALPLLVDGGIRRGTDVLKAIALGARAVLVGRPIVFALAAAGPQGVAHALRLLRDELEIAMALAGVATLADVSRELLFEASKSSLGAPWERPR